MSDEGGSGGGGGIGFGGDKGGGNDYAPAGAPLSLNSNDYGGSYTPVSAGSGSSSVPGFSDFSYAGDYGNYGGFSAGPSSYAPGVGFGSSSGDNSGNALGAIQGAIGASGPQSAFSPTPGVDLGNAFPDPTSSAYAENAPTSFNERWGDTTPSVNGTSQENVPLPTPRPPQADAVDYPGADSYTGPAFETNGGSSSANIPVQPAAAPQSLDQLAYGNAGPPVSLAPLGTIANPGKMPNSGASSAPSLGSTSGNGGSDTGGFLSSLGVKNPLQTAIAAGGLAAGLFGNSKTPSGYDDLKAAAANLNSTGSVLQQYLTTGTLPPGMQTSVDQATQAAKARVVQNYANRGLSTDPTKNSSLQQELAQIDQQAVITAATIGDSLMKTGLSASGMANQIYQALVKIDTDKSQRVGSAISNFASSLGGGQTGSNINLKLG